MAYRCEKTPYADFIDKLVAKTSALIIYYMKDQPTEEQREFISIISKSFINSLFDLLHGDYERERLSELLSKLIQFTFNNINERI